MFLSLFLRLFTFNYDCSMYYLLSFIYISSCTLRLTSSIRSDLIIGGLGQVCVVAPPTADVKRGQVNVI